MQINGGPIEVDDVSRLLLTTETIAAAEFAWHVKFNGAARILTGKDSQTGRGTVEFGKQPDGTWVLASFDL